MSKTNRPEMTAAMTRTLDLVRAGQGYRAHIGSLRALRDRGLLTFSVKTTRCRFGRGVGMVDVNVTLTDAGRAA